MDDEAAVVAGFILKEVNDWEDDLKCRARFKALSGQRSDWEPLYHFWRDLILKVARHLGVFIIRPSRVTNLWFRRSNGLTPLCLNRILIEMHRTGDLLEFSNSKIPNYNPLRYILSKAIDFLATKVEDDSLTGKNYVLAELLEENALQLLDVLTESHWTASCIITMRKFQDICGGSEESIAILNYLSLGGRASSLILDRKTDRIEGVKVCLAPGAVSTATSTDYSILHLTWTSEKLEQQINLVDQRFQKTRSLALASLKSGNKKIALKYAKEMKVISMGRERCSALLDRVEKVLNVISDADSAKKVTEAIQDSSQLIRENMICIEDVQLCLQEIDENIDSLRQIDIALESTSTYMEIDDEDIEDEFDKLQLEIGIEMDNGWGKSKVDSQTNDALVKALSDLDIKGNAGINSVVKSSLEPIADKRLENGILEAV